MIVRRCLTDGEKDGLRWPALFGHGLSCTGCWLYLLSVKWLMCDTLSLHIFTSLGCFSRRIVFSENRIGQVTLDLFYMGFAYYFKDNQQEFCRLNKLFYLWSLGPWMNYVWWFTFRFGIFIVSWCESFIWWRVIFLLIPCLYSCFIHNPSFASQIFPLKLIYPQIAFYTRYFGLTFFVDVVSTLCKETCMFTI